MKKYSPDERVQLAQIIRGVRDLSRHSDAYLAELGQVHRGNVTSFNTQKRPHAISTRTIDELLWHYGFVYDSQVGVTPADGDHCPLITLRTEFDRENNSLKDFVNALKTSGDLRLCPIENVLGDFALIWAFNDVQPPEGWCAVAMGLGANNSAFEQLLANGVKEGPSFKVDDATFRKWRATSPRKSEVFEAYLRNFRAASMALNLEKAMGDGAELTSSSAHTDRSLL
jgi:hypothetical protein